MSLCKKNKRLQNIPGTRRFPTPHIVILHDFTLSNMMICDVNHTPYYCTRPSSLMKWTNISRRKRGSTCARWAWKSHPTDTATTSLAMSPYPVMSSCKLWRAVVARTIYDT
jgi:hypothetical protein